MGRLCLREATLFTVVYICMFCLGTQKAVQEEPSRRRVCNSKGCNKAADFIRDMLNTTIDPCSNFYDYVCQRWIFSNPIPEDKVVHGIISDVDTGLKVELKDILGNETLCPKVPERPKITNKILTAYNSCMSEAICENENLHALRQVMKDVGLVRWPVEPNEDAPNWEDTFSMLLAKLGMSPIFVFGVEQDVKNVTSYAIQLDQVHFGGVGRNEFLNQSDKHNKDIINAYKKYIMGITKLVTEHDGTTMAEDKLEAFAEQVVSIEAELAKRSRPKEERRDYNAMYTKKTVNELQKELPQVNWSKLFNDIFKHVNISVDEQEGVIIWENEYYNTTLRYLNTLNRSTLHNYFGLKVVSKLGPYTSEKFRELRLGLSKVITGVQKQEERWRRCVTDLEHYADHALGRIYVEKMFSRDAKEEMEDIVTELRKTFHTLIAMKDWMDNSTKFEALKKVDGMTTKIGYPDWLMNDTYLDRKYKYVKEFQPGTPYVTLVSSLRENAALQELERLHTYYNKSLEWHTGAAVVNAFYDAVSNDISFPAGILQFPFYEYGLPLSFNMGGIGATIGHEVTHAFDDTGSQFDAEGKLHNWWSTETRNAFNKGAQCFINQYANITDDQTSLKLNGINSQGENIADNGGLIGAFLTYKALLHRKDKKYEDIALPGLEHITGDQLFFIATSVTWCDNVREETLRQIIQYDSHAPAKYRITVPASNMDEFATAFNCSQGAAMKACKKCRIW